MSKNDTAIIFRKYVLPYSETFIADQGRFLRRYEALFTGYKNDITGKELLGDSPRFILQDYTNNLELSKVKLRIGIINKKWLREIQHHSPSVIHAHFLKDGIDATILRDKLSLPLITTLHGHDITKPEKKSLLTKSRQSFFQKVDKIITVSDYIYRHALNNGCPEDKLVKHSIGIDIKKFNQEKRESSNPELLFVGRLTEKKGCIYLLMALTQLQHKYSDIKLTIVGDGPKKNELLSYVQQNKLNVDFVGKETAEQIRNRLASCWVFAAPSITANNGDAEGLGMVFLEAQALRTPVVSFKSGGVVEAVDDGTTGLLSEEKDVEGLVEGISYFIENPGIRRDYGNRGRERVEQKFDIRKQCLLLEDIYDSVR